MRRWKILFYILLFSYVFILSSCTNLYKNEIENKSYNVTIDINDFENLVKAASLKASMSIVGVSNYQKTRGISKLSSVGSGVIYDCKATLKNGKVEDSCEKTINSSDVLEYNYNVVTNHHVIEGNDYLKVYIGDSEEKLDAKEIASDEEIDIAIVSFKHYKYFPICEFGDSNNFGTGSFVIAVGNPSGYDYYNSTTFGIVSHSKRNIGKDVNDDGIDDFSSLYIQHDASLNPGSSGGGLFNLNGELIGINTLKLISEKVDGMGFAIPSNLVKNLIKSLENGDKPKKVSLDILGSDVTSLLNQDNNSDNKILVPEGIKYGIYINEVINDGTSDGVLFTGDYVVRINDEEVKNMNVLRAYLLFLGNKTKQVWLFIEIVNLLKFQ